MTENPESGTSPSGPAPLPPATSEEPLSPRRLHRSSRDHVIGGVCGGLAEYFGVDAVLLRIVAVALALSGGAGLLLYIVAWIVIPEDTAVEPTAEGGPVARAETGQVRSSTATGTVIGAVIVAAGVLMFLNQLLPWVNARLIWPLIVIGGGIAVLTSGRRRP